MKQGGGGTCSWRPEQWKTKGMNENRGTNEPENKMYKG